MIFRKEKSTHIPLSNLRVCMLVKPFLVFLLSQNFQLLNKFTLKSFVFIFEGEKLSKCSFIYTEVYSLSPMFTGRRREGKSGISVQTTGNRLNRGTERGGPAGRQMGTTRGSKGGDNRTRMTFSCTRYRINSQK